MSNSLFYGPGRGFIPFNDTTPFTFRDSYTFLEKLDEFLQTLNVVENRELEFIAEVNKAVADGKEAANTFMAEMTANYLKILSQLIGYTIDIDDETYRASMMDGSVFEAYTIVGVDNKLTVFMNSVESSINTFTNAVNNQISRKSHGWVNVKEFGAVGDGLAFEYNAFRDAFAGGNKTIYVPAGEYRINHHIRLEPNTVVEMHPNAVLINESEIEYVFLNGKYGSNAFSTAYNGPGNIVIRGGVFDGRVKVGQFRNSCFIGISHADNILIENVTFRNGYSSHLVEINSSKNVTIRNCVFNNLNPAGLENREFINIDYSFGIGYPPHGAYDGTPCLNVTVENCEFSNGSDGVGTHSSPGGNKHVNIKILNNRFSNLSAHAITPRYWKDSLISGNTVDGALTAVRMSPCESVTAANNLFTNVGNIENSVMYVNEAPNCVLTNNVIKPKTGNVYTEGIVVSGASTNTVIDTKGITPGTRDGKVRVYNSAQPSTIDGTLTVFMENDSVYRVEFPGGGKQGVVTIASRSGAGNAPRGMYWLRCTNDSEKFIEALSTVAYQDNVILGTGVPTVATLELGKFGVFAGSDGRFYLVNRSGSTRLVDISFVGG